MMQVEAWEVDTMQQPQYGISIEAMLRKQANVKVVVEKDDVNSVIVQIAESNLKIQMKQFRWI